MALFLLLLPVLLLHSVLSTSHDTPNCVLLDPNPADSNVPVELGKEFTVTCLLRHPLKADDIVWAYSNGQRQIKLPRQYYKKINDTAGTITVNATEDMKQFFTCSVRSELLPHNNCSHTAWGIRLDVGYPPEVPTGLTCKALQDGPMISKNVTCSWNPGKRNPRIHTIYTLYIEVAGQKFYRHATNHSGTVTLDIFPNHSTLKIWVEVENALGKAKSEMEVPAENTIKTNPPAKVRIPEPAFSKSLLIQWNPAIDQSYVRLKYNIRYREKDSTIWLEVPQEDTRDSLDSFRLQGLKPSVEYEVEVRCKNEDDLGYWSEWSQPVTKRTAEDRPSSAPDIWVKSAIDGSVLSVHLFLKKPVESNGEIIAYNITVVEKGESKQLHSLLYKGRQSDDQPFQTYEFNVRRDSVTSVEVTANNSIGVSPKADMAVPLSAISEHPSVEDLVVFSENDMFQVEWRPPARLQGPALPSEYLLEWRSLLDGQWDWQREPRNATKAHIRGTALIRPYVPYNVTVTPIYKRKYREKSSSNIIELKPAGNPKTVTLYLKEGEPVAVPVVEVVRTWKRSAELKWEEIPLEKRRGFITNYTVVYESEGKVFSETVPPHVHRLVLNNLQKDQYYTIRLVASTVAGSKSSDGFNMRTAKYDPGEIEMIVVAVCFGFLFLTMLTLRICFKNRETLQKWFWPTLPNPYKSTVAAWSPDLSARAGSPKEVTASELSVVEVDVFERRSLCGGGEDDKGSLAALKKDKYLSEEHSSGIGGSSCMSSPRHSVSDSDEADSAQTTASTVQYSAVVGYKGQTPGGAGSSSSSSSTSTASNNSSSSSSDAGLNGSGNSAGTGNTGATSSQAHTFARSESTQPLLDCEEQQEGSGPHHHHHQGGRAGSLFRRQPYHHGLGHADGGGGRLHPSEQDEQDSLEFCPVEDAAEPSQPPTATAATDQPHPGQGRPAYMPQQSGYRPQ